MGLPVPTTQNTIQMKTGSSLLLNMTHLDSDEVPIDITDYSIDIDFIHPKTQETLLECDLENFRIQVLDGPAGEFRVNGGEIPTDGSWPLTHIPVDIKYTLDNVVQHTDYFYLEVIQGISQ